MNNELAILENMLETYDFNGEERMLLEDFRELLEKEAMEFYLEENGYKEDENAEEE